jgi:hypothetical protein
MWNWILQRAKAFVAIAAPAVTAATLKAVEQSFGFDIPTDIEVGIISAVTGLVVHQTPNQA